MTDTVRIVDCCGIAVRIFILHTMAQQRILVAGSTACPKRNRTVSVVVFHEAAGNTGKVAGNLHHAVSIFHHVAAGSMCAVVHQRCNQLAVFIHKLDDCQSVIAVACKVSCLYPVAARCQHISVHIHIAERFAETVFSGTHRSNRCFRALDTFGFFDFTEFSHPFHFIRPCRITVRIRRCIMRSGMIMCSADDDTVCRETGRSRNLVFQIFNGGMCACFIAHEQHLVRTVVHSDGSYTHIVIDTIDRRCGFAPVLLVCRHREHIRGGINAGLRCAD